MPKGQKGVIMTQDFEAVVMDDLEAFLEMERFQNLPKEEDGLSIDDLF